MSNRAFGKKIQIIPTFRDICPAFPDLGPYGASVEIQGSRWSDKRVRRPTGTSPGRLNR